MAAKRVDGWRGVFLRGLARTGNVGLAAVKAGVDRQTAYNWRAADGGFAAAWDRAKAWGQARVAAGAGDPEEVVGPVAVRVSKREGAQIVRAGEGRMSEADKGAFLGHLRRTGTAAHAAAAVGFSTTALYNRRKKDARFAEDWGKAKEAGCRRVSLGLLDAAEAALDPERDAAAEGLPAVSVSEAIAILKVHRFDRGDGEGGKKKPWQKLPSAEEVTEKIISKVNAITRHRDKQRLAMGWVQTEAGEWIPPGWSYVGGGGDEHRPEAPEGEGEGVGDSR